jgi:hypothetical protein
MNFNRTFYFLPLLTSLSAQNGTFLYAKNLPTLLLGYYVFEIHVNNFYFKVFILVSYSKVREFLDKSLLKQ